METRRRTVPGKWRIIPALALALVLFAVGGNVVWADSAADNFTWIIFPGADVSAAATGDTVQMAGAGTLSFHPKTVAGGGTFTEKNAAGATIATGTWTALELLSFDDYGQTPGFPVPTAHGGRALMRVHLSTGADAILEFVCALGNPPSGQHEGIQLAVDGGPNFNMIVAGATVFLAI